MIDEAEGRRIASVPKRSLDLPVWTERGNHAGSKHCTSVLIDQQGVTLPGLTVSLEAKAPINVQSCFYQFTIFRLLHRRRERAYQLAVYPAGKRAHNAPGNVIYGPHEHFGEAAFPVADPSVDCADWPACFAWFCQRCNLEPFPIEPPC